MVQENKQGLSSITIKEQGKIVEKSSGKTITQDFHFKIYTDKLGEEARQELVEIRNKFDSKIGNTKRTPDNPPLAPGSLAI